MNHSFLKIALATAALISPDLNAALKNNPGPTSASPIPPAPASTPCACLRGGERIEKNQCPAAYNLPAIYTLNHDCRWFNDFFFDVSYTYWHATEEGLEAARSAALSSGTVVLNSPATLFNLPFAYQSGFQVGAGWRHNDWMISGEYTWVRNQISKSATAPAANSLLTGDTGVWQTPWFVHPSAHLDQFLSGPSINTAWHLAIDLADLMISRPFYQGPRVIINPFGGLRAAWIRQVMEVSLTEGAAVFTTLSSQPIESSTRSGSWAIGPRFGSDAQVLLWRGLRLQGDLAASVLFTQYTKLSHTEQAGSATDAVRQYELSYGSDYNTVRTILETGLGLGWGSYYYKDRYHFDLSAQYDFKVFWNQNMMRYLVDAAGSGSACSNDLYLHGLTLKGRFDF